MTRSQPSEGARLTTENTGSKSATLYRQALLRVGRAAEYLGIHSQTLRKLTDEGLIKAVRYGSEGSSERRYTVQELDRYIASLPQWYYGDGERSEASHGDQNHNE